MDNGYASSAKGYREGMPLCLKLHANALVVKAIFFQALI